MRILDELQRLTSRADDTPPRPGREVFARARRRRTARRTATGVTGAAVLALAVAVAWPGSAPGGLTIDDEVADTPDVTEETAPDAPVLELPDGWQAVQVGDALFGVPGDREIVEVTPDDRQPCPNSDLEPRVYVARDGLPVSEDGCDAVGYSVASVVATPAEAAPIVNCPTCEQGPLVTDAGVTGSVVEFEDGGNGTDRSYTFPELDLHLDFRALDLEPGLDEAVIDTIRPLADPSASATDDQGDDVTDPTAVPEGDWVLVEGTGPDGEITLVDEFPTTLGAEVGPPNVLDDERHADAVATWLGSTACLPYAAPVLVDEATGDLAPEVSSGVGDLEGCVDVALESHDGYLAALAAVTAVAEEDGRLVLTGPDVRLVFEQLPAPGGDDGSTTDGPGDGDGGDDDEPVREIEIAGARLTLTIDPPTEVRSVDEPVPSGVCGILADQPIVQIGTGIDPEPAAGGSCGGGTDLTAPYVVASPLGGVPPMMLPGHADPDGDHIEEVDLGEVTAQVESYELQDGTRATTYVIRELDLYLEVHGEELDPDWVEDLLASIEPA